MSECVFCGEDHTLENGKCFSFLGLLQKIHDEEFSTTTEKED